MAQTCTTGRRDAAAGPVWPRASSRHESCCARVQGEWTMKSGWWRNRGVWRGVQMAVVLLAAGCSSGKGPAGGTSSTFCDDYLHAVSNKFVLCQGGSTTAFNELFHTVDLCSGIS